MQFLKTVEELEAVYGEPGPAAVRKVATHLTPLYRKWIMASRFCVVSTVGPEGTDGSPRGDDGPVVTELNPKTLAMPDWHGNNRIDTLRNLVRDPRISLMFMVPGSNNVVRVNGRAKVTLDNDLRAQFEFKGKRPRAVMVVEIEEIYTQCARALMRARIWCSEDESANLPTVGEILAEQTAGEEGGKAYDDAWGPRASKTMW